MAGAGEQGSDRAGSWAATSPPLAGGRGWTRRTGRGLLLTACPRFIPEPSGTGTSCWKTGARRSAALGAATFKVGGCWRLIQGLAINLVPRAERGGDAPPGSRGGLQPARRGGSERFIDSSSLPFPEAPITDGASRQPPLATTSRSRALPRARPAGVHVAAFSPPPDRCRWGSPSPSTPRQARSCRPEFALQFLWQRGKKKKKKNSKHLILQPTWEPFKLPVRCLTCNNFSAFKIILKRSFSLSLKISAVEPPKEISIKNTDARRKYQFVTVAGDRQPQAPGKWKGTELHGTGAARGRRWLRADPGHGMGTGWERQHRESWAGGRGQERRWAGC